MEYLRLETRKDRRDEDCEATRLIYGIASDSSHMKTYPMFTRVLIGVGGSGGVKVECHAIQKKKKVEVQAQKQIREPTSHIKSLSSSKVGLDY